jgi:hypothetical protein
MHPGLYPFHSIPFDIQLPLQLIPDHCVYTGFFESIPDLPDRGEIRDFLGKAEEVPET